MPEHDIEPSSERARILDTRMRRQLVESLEVLAECYAPADFPEVGALEDFIAALNRGHSPSPVDYGRYYQLATATFAEDASAVRRALAGFAPDKRFEPPFFTRWSEPSESPLQDMAADRFGEMACLFHAVGTDSFRLFCDRLNQGLRFLDRCWPEMAAEVAVLVRHVLVATSAPAATDHFDGGSHYQLWGLLILNPAFHSSPLAMAEVLVHEASHLLLFGLTTEEPLVRNPEGSLFPSPLRRDRRPMDGIVHAAYVSARMALTMDRVAADPVLDPDIRYEARRLRDEDMANFHRGADVVRAHADFTETGLSIFARAERAMKVLAQSIDEERGLA